MLDQRPILSARDISKAFHPRDGKVLDALSLEVDAGETMAIAGPSGCGKTTLLSILAGLTPADAGALVYRFPGRAPATRLTAELRRAHLGLVFQAIHLIPTLTLAENVELPLFGLVADRRARARQAREALERVGLRQAAERKPREVSGGEQQRAAVARAFVNRPSLILADEPTGNLDRESSDRVMDALMEMTARADCALVLVTHDPMVSARLGRRLEMVDGRLAERDPAPRRAAAGI